MNYTINELYARYKNKVITKSRLETDIYNYCKNNRKNTVCCFWKEEEYEDFLSWLYPRLKKIISKYSEKGYSFELFFNKCFYLASKEYKIKKITVSINEYSAWSAFVPELYAHENEPDYLTGNNQKIIEKIMENEATKKNSRRILALILKCYCYVSDDFIEKAALVINIKKEDLKNMMEKIRILRKKKDDKIYKLKEKLYCLHFKSIALEKKLSLINDNTTEHIKLARKLEFIKKRHKKLKERLKRIKPEAANREIAEVIGVSKGCVDSSLYKLKEKFNLN